MSQRSKFKNYKFLKMIIFLKSFSQFKSMFQVFKSFQVFFKFKSTFEVFLLTSKFQSLTHFVNCVLGISVWCLAV